VRKNCEFAEGKRAKKTAKAEPEPETKPVTVKHSHEAEDPDDFGISDQQMIFAQHVVDGKPRVEAYRLAGYSDVGHGAYANASR
jgi:hypothetical protein